MTIASRLQSLLPANRDRGFVRAEKSGAEATIYLYDVIASSDAEAAWWGGVSPRAFAKALDEVASASVVHLRVNSPGGDAFGGRAIYQMLVERGLNVIAHVDGYAASAASLIIMAATRIDIAPGAMIMIHNAWAGTVGNAADLRAMAELLDKVDQAQSATYAARSGMAEDAIRAMMAAETWMTAEQAVEFGFADALATPDAAQPASSISWDMAAYRHPPEAAAAPIPAEKIPAAAAPSPAEPLAEARDNQADHRARVLRLRGMAV